MAGVNFDCDWRNSLLYNSRKPARSGYLLSWTGIGGVNLKADISAINPHTTKGAEVLKGPSVKCAGLISEFKFLKNGEPTDPIRISCYVSPGNASALSAKISSGYTNTKVKFSYVIADYDAGKLCWFECALVKDNKKAEGAIDTYKGQLQLEVDTMPTIVTRTVYHALTRVTFQVVPLPKKTVSLGFATAAKDRVIKSWGVKS